MSDVMRLVAAVYIVIGTAVALMTGDSGALISSTGFGVLVLLLEPRDTR